MAQARRKQDQDPPEEERLEEEEQGDDPEAEGSYEEQENGSGVNISIEGNHITVELQRDGSEGDTLHRIGDLVDGL